MCFLSGMWQEPIKEDTLTWTLWLREPGLSHTLPESVRVYSQDEPTSFVCSSAHIPGLLFHQPSTPALSHLPFSFQHWLLVSHSAHLFSSVSLVPGSLLLQNIPLSLPVTPGSGIPPLFICIALQSSSHRNTLLYKSSHAETLHMHFSCPPGANLLLSMFQKNYIMKSLESREFKMYRIRNHRQMKINQKWREKQQVCKHSFCQGKGLMHWDEVHKEVQDLCGPASLRWWVSGPAGGFTASQGSVHSTELIRVASGAHFWQPSVWIFISGALTSSTELCPQGWLLISQQNISCWQIRPIPHPRTLSSRAPDILK